MHRVHQFIHAMSVHARLAGTPTMRKDERKKSTQAKAQTSSFRCKIHLFCRSSDQAHRQNARAHVCVCVRVRSAYEVHALMFACSVVAACHLTNHDTTFFFWPPTILMRMYFGNERNERTKRARGKSAIFIKVINLIQRRNKFIHF